MTDATSGDEKYSHIEEKDKQAVVEKAATVQKWLEDQIARQSERPKNVDPILTSEEIQKKKDEIIYFCHPLLAKPKPKAAVPSPGTETPKSGTETPNPPPPQKEETQGPSEMDVD
jgi:heat shock protein 4